MKKIILSIAVAFVSAFSFAEDNCNIVPLKLTSDQAKSGSTGTLTLYVVNTDCPDLTTVGLRVYLPTGMKTSVASATPMVTDYFDAAKTCVWKPAGYGLVTLGANAGIEETTGIIACTIPYTLTADLADGVYPVSCTSVKMANYDNTINLTCHNSYSYIVVGNGGSLAFSTKSTSTADYDLPSFVMDGLNSETAVSSLDLTPIKAIYGTYALVDGRTIVAPEGGLKVDKATYTRTVTGYGSLKLPFEVTEGGTFYTTEVTAAPSDGGYVHFDADTKLAANTAAIIKDETVNVSTTDFTITSVAPKTINTGYYVKSAGIYQVNGSAVINPYRASWDFGSAVKGFTFGDDATGISTVELDENGSIYDLNGRKLNKAGRGVNIINGQKILKK